MSEFTASIQISPSSAGTNFSGPDLPTHVALLDEGGRASWTIQALDAKLDQHRTMTPAMPDTILLDGLSFLALTVLHDKGVREYIASLGLKPDAPHIDFSRAKNYQEISPSALASGLQGSKLTIVAHGSSSIRRQFEMLRNIPIEFEVAVSVFERFRTSTGDFETIGSFDALER